MTLYLHLLLFFLTAILCSCTSENSIDVNQDKIHAEYELFYDSNEDKTYAKAKFRFSSYSGTALKLSSPSEVTFNGDILNYEPTFAFYQKEYAGFKQSGTFVWKDTKGKKYSNTISVNTASFPAISKIKRDSSYTMTWQGNPVADKESIAIVMTGSNGGTPQLFIQNNVGSSNIIFPKNQLQQLVAGSATLSMDRSFQPAISEATGAGGMITGKYRASNITVLLE